MALVAPAPMSPREARTWPPSVRLAALERENERMHVILAQLEAELCRNRELMAAMMDPAPQGWLEPNKYRIQKRTAVSLADLVLALARNGWVITPDQRPSGWSRQRFDWTVGSLLKQGLIEKVDSEHQRMYRLKLKGGDAQ